MIVKGNKTNSITLTLEDSKTPRKPNPTSIILVNAAVKLKFPCIEDTMTEKCKLINKAAKKSVLQSMDIFLKRRGAMD